MGRTFNPEGLQHDNGEPINAKQTPESTGTTRLSAEAVPFTTETVSSASGFGNIFQTTDGDLTHAHESDFFYASQSGRAEYTANGAHEASNNDHLTPIKAPSRQPRARTEQSNLVISPYTGQAIVLLEGAVNTESLCPLYE
eukprot:gb/GECG01009474.1/.p1 GENE.gb/GECG01009474.1/~~gb/GECG01009474.1/.p1  ORF type:complete len:141 (+),score=9.80 gb/GECG01009474.1/:1-423(+)